MPLGSSWTLIVQLASFAKDVPQLPPAAIAKPLPVMLGVPRTSGAAPVFVMVTSRVSGDAAGCWPKSTAAVMDADGEVATPFRVAERVNVLLPALKVTANGEVLAPTVDGLNPTENVH